MARPEDTGRGDGIGDLPSLDAHGGAAAVPIEELTGLYAALRRELDQAYASRPLDSARLDGLAQELLRLECTLAWRGALDTDIEGPDPSATRLARPA